MAVQHRAQTICVLGGTGFVGRSICNLLVKQGYSVRVPSRRPERHRRLRVLPAVELCRADVHDEAALRRLLQGCDAAVNLIGILNEKGHDGTGFMRVHAELPEKLLRACQEMSVTRVLHMSALKANAERGPSHYLRSKGFGERAVKELSGEEIRYTIFKPSVIFGAGDSFLSRFAGLLRYAPVLPLPAMSAQFAPVHVDDVAAAFVQAINDSRTFGQSYELCGPEVYSLGGIVRYIRDDLGLRRAIVPMPAVLARIQAWVADYLIPGKPFSLDNLRSLSVASVCSENGFAKLGIVPRAMTLLAPEFLTVPVGRLSYFRRVNQH